MASRARRAEGRERLEEETRGPRCRRGPAGSGEWAPEAPTRLVPAPAGPARPCCPSGPPPAGPADGRPGQGGARRLNHLSLCSSQLNGSGQLKMSSHCLSAQMLAPPPPGLPRLALPPATKPTSEGGSTSPTSPCKHSGSGARGRAGVPEGPPPLPSPTAGARGSGPACRVLVSLVGPQTEAHRGPRQP